MAEKPTLAFVLSLIGGMIYFLTGIIIAAASALVGSLASFGSGFGAMGAVGAAAGAMGIISGTIMVVGAVMMNTSERSKVRIGAILVLVLTIIGAIFTVGGFVIGFILP